MEHLHTLCRFFSKREKQNKNKNRDKIIIQRKQKRNKDEERVRPRINKYGRDKIKSRRK